MPTSSRASQARFGSVIQMARILREDDALHDVAHDRQERLPLHGEVEAASFARCSFPAA